MRVSNLTLPLKRLLFGTALLAFLAPPPLKAAEQLPALKANLSRTSVSGLSSGAYMAGQFHIAHSNLVIGAGIVAGGPYGCAESWQARNFPFMPGIVTYNAAKALQGCMKANMLLAGIPNPQNLYNHAKDLAEDEEIDPLTNLANDHVYLFTGGKDAVVEHEIVETAARFYALAGVAKENISLDRNPNAGHSFITEDSGGKCQISEKPYLADCDYDQAGAILRAIYGSLNPPGDPQNGQLLLFDQKPYLASSASGMGEDGALFIPNTCRTQPGCHVHIIFHGCEQSLSAVGDIFIKGAGFRRWAVTNRLILLFPQIGKNSANPNGCWDWWGYTGLSFQTKSAPQIEAVFAMMKKLAD